MRRAVAISTTGDEHRLGFLETCVEAWDKALGPGDSLFVTVDGNAADVCRVAEAVHFWTESVFRVGQLHINQNPVISVRRQGVAVNKNTGLELMMDNTRAEHLFLSDDDTWPLYRASLDKHIEYTPPHSMVNWGRRRVDSAGEWSWPRGVMLYAHRSVIERVGGMDERFGAGGHEHAEWSMRIHTAGLTPQNFPSPPSYLTRNAKGASALWHAEDMARVGEAKGTFLSRKAHFTTITRGAADWERIHKIMDERAGSSDYAGYRAHENGRSSATLSRNLTGLGAGGEA